MITFMWAQAKNFTIGKNNKLPWHIKEEMNLFVHKTKNQNILMGRKTYDSIPFKPLKEKKSISVISRTLKQAIYNEKYFTSIEDAIKEVGNDIIIIGGVEIFELAKPYVDKLYISSIHKDYDGDVYMPKFEIGKNQINLFDQTFTLQNQDNFDEFTFYEYTKSNS